MDINGDGELSSAEILSGKDKFLLEGQGVVMTDQDILLFVQLADADGDGVISLTEFIEGATLYEEQLVQH